VPSCSNFAPGRGLGHSGLDGTRGQGRSHHSITPHQFARAECANFDQTSGACKGIGIKEDGSLFSFGSKPACVLNDRKARCAYFEQCVLPTRFDDPSQSGQVRAKSHQEAVNLYTAGTTGEAKSKRPICPHCRKREIEPPKRFCYQCAEDRKQASHRISNRESMRSSRHVDKNASPMP
jgi:hypothetical protein